MPFIDLLLLLMCCVVCVRVYAYVRVRAYVCVCSGVCGCVCGFFCVVFYVVVGVASVDADDVADACYCAVVLIAVVCMRRVCVSSMLCVICVLNNQFTPSAFSRACFRHQFTYHGRWWC